MFIIHQLVMGRMALQPSTQLPDCLDLGVQNFVASPVPYSNMSYTNFNISCLSIRNLLAHLSLYVCYGRGARETKYLKIF